MVPTTLPFSPRPLGPLDTRRRRRRAHRMAWLRRPSRTVRLLLAACLAAGLTTVGLGGLGRAMQLLQTGATAGTLRLAEAGSGVVHRLDLPPEFSARLDAGAER